MNEGLVVGSSSELPPAVATNTTVHADSVARGPAVRVDFAHVFRNYLLVYGWVFGLSKWVASAAVRHGEQSLDLLSLAVRMPRPDVTQHFSPEEEVDDDEHGFCLLAPLQDFNGEPSSLLLSVALHSGATAESFWPIGRGEQSVTDFFQQNRTTLGLLLARLRPAETAVLRDLLLPPALPVPASVSVAPAIPPALRFQFEVDLCCVLENRILLILGWLIDLDKSLTGAQVRIGATTLDFLGGLVFSSRPDIESKAPKQGNGAAAPGFGFTFSAAIAQPSAASGEVVFEFATPAGQARIRRSVSDDPGDARRDLTALLSKLESDAAIALIERVAGVLDSSPQERALFELLEVEIGRAVERLPVSLECASPRFFLHLDRVITIANEGVFLNGWFHAQPAAVSRVSCRRGFTSIAIDDTWVCHQRGDVTAHLANMGIAAAENDHGFACYVPLRSKGAPYFISVTTQSGLVRSMRLPPATPAASALDTVRAVLTSFNIEHRALRPLLDLQVGPAVRDAWAGRQKSRREPALRRFGAAPASPQVTIIVPLYGRHDLAEYQLALFADDAEFQDIELIYFVDDPAIYDEFRLRCADLHGIYQVPFTLAFAGTNLGFAGANNCAAQVARGRYLLLLNSDVFPKRPGWVGEMLRVFTALPDPGLLGAKLLYEDGSVQHAGMAFRQHPPWCDLWINYHPHKGQSPQGLSGVREVDAVTAACVLVDSGLYRELGGLSEEYIVGDFEDSDLCLRAALAGRRNRVVLDVELYHLERQSQDRIGDSQWRTNLTAYNCWLHDQRWAARIEKPVR
jgi:GT2 family glycosyltransferase